MTQIPSSLLFAAAVFACIVLAIVAVGVGLLVVAKLFEKFD